MSSKSTKNGADLLEIIFHVNPIMGEAFRYENFALNHRMPECFAPHNKNPVSGERDRSLSFSFREKRSPTIVTDLFFSYQLQSFYFQSLSEIKFINL